MRWKRILIIVALVIVALVVAAYVILSSYDFNKLKPMIAREVKKATGRELTLDGNIELDVGFTLGLSAEEVSFQNAPWGSRPDLAKIRRVKVQVAALPLIFGNIDVKRLILVEPDILVETDSSGKSNLKFEVPEKQKGKPPVLVFEEIRIERGLLTYKDGLSDKTYSLNLDRLTAAAPGMESPIGMKLKGVFSDRPFEIQGTLGPLVALIDPDETWPVALTAKTQGASVTIEGAITRVRDALGLDFTVVAKGQSIPDIAELAGVTRVPDLGPFELAATVSGPIDRLTVEKVDLQVGSEGLAEMRLEGAIEDLLAQRGIGLNFTIEGKDVANLEKLVGGLLPVKGPFVVSGEVVDPSDRLYKVTNLRAVLGENDFGGWVALNLAGERPRVTSELSSERFDLRPLLTRSSADAEWVGDLPDLGPFELAVKLAGPLDELTVENLDFHLGTEGLVEVSLKGAIKEALVQRGIDLNFTVRGKELASLGKFVGQPMPISGVFAVSGRLVDHEAKVYKVSDLKVVLGENNLGGSVDVNVAGERPRVTGELSSERFSLQPLLPSNLAEPSWLKGVPDLGPFKLALTVVDPAGELALEDLELQVGTDDLAKVRISGSIKDPLAQRGIRLNFTIRGKDLGRLEKVMGQPLPVQGLFILSGKVIDTTGKIYEVADLRAMVGGNDLDGSVALNLAGKPLRVAVELSSKRFDPRPLLASHMTEPGWLKDLPDLGRFSLAVTLVDPAGKLAVEGLDLLVGSEGLVEARITGAIQDVLARKGIDLNFTVQGKDLANLEKFVGEPLPIQGPFVGSGHVADPADGIYRFSDLKAVLGENDFRGSVELNVAGERPRVTAELSSERFDLRPLLAKADKKDATEGEAAESGRKQNKVFPDEPLPLDTLRVADANLKIRAGQILLPRLAIDDLVVDIVLEDGHLTAEPLKCIVGGGLVEGRFDLSVQNKEAEIATELKIDGLDLGAMLEELGVEKYLEGTVGAEIGLNGRGGSVAGLMAGLNGSILFVTRSGRINNRYIGLLGGDLTSQVFRLINPLSEREKYTEINCSVNHFDIKDGLARCKAWVIDTKYTNVFGGGDINLETERLNLAFRLSPQRGVGVSGVGKVSLSLGKLANSFKLGGTLAKPSLVIDPRGTTITVGKAVGGVALFGPFGIAAALVDVSPGDKNPCLTAFETAKKGVEVSGGEEPKKKKGPLKRLFGK